MEIVLQRITLSSNMPTLGVLLKDNLPLCVTVEKPWVNNKNKVSCIPEGIYNVVPHTGAKFSNVWHICDVPNRQAILIHKGNSMADVEGCIAIGTTFDNAGGVINSGVAYKLLRSVLPASFNLTIKNPKEV